VVEVESNDKAR